MSPVYIQPTTELRDHRRRLWYLHHFSLKPLSQCVAAVLARTREPRGPLYTRIYTHVQQQRSLSSPILIRTHPLAHPHLLHRRYTHCSRSISFPRKDACPKVLFARGSPPARNSAATHRLNDYHKHNPRAPTVNNVYIRTVWARQTYMLVYRAAFALTVPLYRV